MSPNHMVLFLVLINLIFQDHVKLGTEGFSVAASSALPHSAGRLCPGLPESCSVLLSTAVSFGKWRVRNKIILLILSLGFGDACSIRMLGVWLQARQDASAMDIKEWSGVGIMDTWAQHFHWYFLQKCSLKELLYRNDGEVGCNCKDGVGANMEACWNTSGRWAGMAKQEEAVVAMSCISSFQLKLWDSGWWRKLLSETVTVGSLCSTVWGCLAGAFSAQLYLLPCASRAWSWVSFLGFLHSCI